jgi:hypothetical protein
MTGRPTGWAVVDLRSSPRVNGTKRALTLTEIWVQP